MLELVFVIVVIGILAIAILPRVNRDTLYEASEQLLSHIKYTQHLAMTDNVYGTGTWYAQRWKIVFDNANDTYSITSGGTNAVDPITGNDIDGSDDYDLDDKYKATINSGATLAFDHLGRPHSGISDAVTDLMTSDLNITISANGESANIIVLQQTGYSYIQW